MEIETDGSALTLSRAIMIYSGGFKLGGAVASHSVSNGELGEGRFLKSREVCELGRALHGKHETEPTKPQLHGADVLGCGSEFLCFYLEPQERGLFFGKNLPDVSGVQVPLPRLIVIQHGSATYLFSVKGASRPSGKTPLYHAPLPEIDHDGSIHSCGIRYKRGVRYDPTKCDEIAETILSARFNSTYSSKTCKGDYAEALKVAVTDGKFPNAKLCPIGKTLVEFIESL